MRIFDFLKSLFSSNNVEENLVEVSPVSNEVVETTEEEQPATEEANYSGYYDIFGNPLNVGDNVVRVKYNDFRVNYATVAKNADVVAYKPTLKYKVLSYAAYNSAAKTDGRKHGYVHVAR